MRKVISQKIQSDQKLREQKFKKNLNSQRQKCNYYDIMTQYENCYILKNLS